MLNRIAEIRVKSKIKRYNLNRKKRFMNWDKVEKIALIMSDADAVNKSAVDKFIQTSGKYVEVFYVEAKSKLPTYNDWKCFYKKDLNLLKLPKNSQLVELEQKKFDLVINTSPEHDLVSTLLSSAIGADLKCGNSNKYNCNELIIEKTETYNLMSHLDNVVKYLKMIQT